MDPAIERIFLNSEELFAAILASNTIDKNNFNRNDLLQLDIYDNVSLITKYNYNLSALTYLINTGKIKKLSPQKFYVANWGQMDLLEPLENNAVDNNVISLGRL